MSQSDYIKYKEISTILRTDIGTKMEPVFNCNDYIGYKKYSLESTIVNNKITMNQLTPSNRQPIFGMEKQITNCPSFIVCKNTNRRTNRILLGTRPTYRPITIKQKQTIEKANALLCETMKC